MSSGQLLTQLRQDGLTRCSTFVYGVGHVLNDLCAACWFNFLLYFLADVQDVSSAAAGSVMLCGQIADGLATPLVGVYSDRFNTRLGKRMPWYIFGTCLVPTSFFFVWETCFPCESMSGSSSTAFQIFWYSLFAALFNIGWASVQIAHMSMIPSLTPVKSRRNTLISLRTGFTYISNVTVLALALLLFATVSDPKEQFVILSLLVIGIGLTINLIFIFTIKERELTETAIESFKSMQTNPARPQVHEDEDLEIDVVEIPEYEQNEYELREITWQEWIRNRGLYPVGAVYMLARLSNNVMTSTLPFYLTTVLHMGGVSSPSEANKKTPWQISLIPLIMYITSVVVSLRMYWISKFLSRRAQYGIGALFTAFGCIPMLVLTHDYQYVTVGIAVLLGVGFSLMLSNAVGFIADFLKMYGTSGGFVWGFISFFDKASSGIALFVITVSFKQNAGNLGDSLYIRICVVGVPLVASVLGAFMTSLVNLQTPYKRSFVGSFVAEE